MNPTRPRILNVVFVATALIAAILVAPGCDNEKPHDDPKDLWVLNTDPYTGETNVYINDPIVITFSSNVDPYSVNNTTILITDPNGAVPLGRFEVHSNEVHFIPQFPPGLSPMMKYTVLLQGLPMSPTVISLEGTPLMQSYQFSFDAGTASRPDTIPPYVVSCNIPNNAVGVSRDVNIDIGFSEPIDTSSVSAGFSLVEVGGGATPINGTLTVSNNQTVLHFDPENGAFPGYLQANAQYQIQLTGAIRDMAGLSLQDPVNTPPTYPPWIVTFTTSNQPQSATARGPFLEDFSTNSNEDAANTTAEWNTVTPQALVSTVFPQATLVQDPGPMGNPVTLNEPFDGGTNGGGWRMACIILGSELAAALGQPLSQLANKPITRLMCKAPAAGPVTGSTYTNLVVRLGLTTNTAFPVTVANFSGLYLQASNVVPATVVCRLSTFTVAQPTTNPPGYFEIPIAPTFIYPGNANDNIIVDIECTGASTTNPIDGDNQAVTIPPPPNNLLRRALCSDPQAVNPTPPPATNYDIITGFDANVPYFAFEFGGGLGSAGVDGNGNAQTSMSFPLGFGPDMNVTTGGALDTFSVGYAYGHIKLKSLNIASGATLTVRCGTASNPPTFSNPCIIRVERTINVRGRINADGVAGANAASVQLAGGNGGVGGPGGGAGGLGGMGATTGNGNNGNGGVGFDNQTLATNGAGQGGTGGAGGGGGGGGGFGVGGTQGLASGAATGGVGGNSWGTPNIVYLAGGAGGGGGGGGVATSGAGGGGGGGGGGYLHIITDRNMYIGPNAQLTARGGRGGGAALLGQGGGGGGGSGGSVYIQALQLTFTGQGAIISAQGGIGGRASAGGGSGAPQTGAPHNHALAEGRIKIRAQVRNQNNCTFSPDANSGLLLIQPGSQLNGVFLQPGNSQEQSTGQSIFLDTTCSWPWYTNAEINFNDTPGVTKVYINFEGADPNILAQPNQNQTLLYTNGTGPAGAEELPSPSAGGQNPTVIDLNNGQINGGTTAGGVSPTGVQALNGLRFIRFIITLETTSATTTAQVNQVIIRYQY